MTRIYVALIFEEKERKERVYMNRIDVYLFSLPKFLVRNIVRDLCDNNIKIINVHA